jgi:hypothetical protein
MKNRDVASTLMGLTVACKCTASPPTSSRGLGGMPRSPSPHRLRPQRCHRHLRTSHPSWEEMDLSDFDYAGGTYGPLVGRWGALHVR